MSSQISHNITRSPYQQTLSLAVIIGSTFFLGLAQGIGYPLTSLTFERWNVDAWITGLAAGMPALAALLLLPFAPRLAARFGLVNAMVYGGLIGLLGFVLLPVWNSVEGWMVLRFVMGLGLLFPWLLAETWINTVSSEEQRGRVLSLYVVAYFGGYGTGPILLGLLPAQGLAPFALGALSLALITIPLALAHRLAPPMDAHPTGSVTQMIRIAPLGMLAGLVAGVLEYTYISLLPTFGLRSGVSEVTALHLVTAFVWGGVALAFPFGWLADRVPRPRLLLWMIVLFIFIAVPAGLMVSTPSFSLPATFMLGGVACGFYTLGLAILGGTVAPRGLASANAAFLIFYQLGTLGAPPIAGGALDAWPLHGFIAATVGFAVMAWIAAASISRRAGSSTAAGEEVVSVP